MTTTGIGGNKAASETNVGHCFGFRKQWLQYFMSVNVLCELNNVKKVKKLMFLASGRKAGCRTSREPERCVSLLTAGCVSKKRKMIEKLHQHQSHPFTCSIASCTSGVKCKIASKSSANSNSSSSIIVKTKLSAALHFLVRWLVGYVMTSEKWCFHDCQKLEIG